MNKQLSDKQKSAVRRNWTKSCQGLGNKKENTHVYKSTSQQLLYKIIFQTKYPECMFNGDVKKTLIELFKLRTELYKHQANIETFRITGEWQGMSQTTEFFKPFFNFRREGDSVFADSSFSFSTLLNAVEGQIENIKKKL